MPTMAVLEKPTDFFTRDEIAALRRLSPWRSTWLIVHCWGVILATWAAAVVWPYPWVIVPAVLIVGARQLGLAVISHDGAHFLLYKNRALNDWICEWLLNRPLLGASVVPYRTYHLNHHRFTQQPNDPDLRLSAPFPITRSSFRRKVARDLTGQTGFKQTSATIVGAFGKPSDPPTTRLVRGVRRLGPNLAINAVFFGGFVAVGHPWLYVLLWIVPDLTWHMFISRVRNIGEHGAVPDNDDRLRNTRTVHANWIERALVAPYFVNYHLEHHLLVSCPCYRLPRAHALLIAKGFRPRMELKPSYPAMLKHAVSKAEPLPA
jgi:fatty acid desaturase